MPPKKKPEPYITALDVKDKIVIVRLIGGKDNADRYMNSTKTGENFIAAGARSVFFCNHLIRVEAWTDEELKKAGLKRTEE